jgi:hypothetical protein
MRRSQARWHGRAREEGKSDLKALPTVASSNPMSLFTEPQPARTGPSSFLVSAVAHCAVLGLMILAIKNAPNIIRINPDQRYEVRLLRLHQPEPRMRWAPNNGGSPSAPKVVAHAARAGTRPSAPKSFAPLSHALETLIQPDAPQTQPLLQQMHVPMVVLWRPENAPTPKIVPPPSKVTAAIVHPQLTKPNFETHVADVELSSSNFPSETLPVPASTTSPIAIPVPGVQEVPESTSKLAAAATAATVMSVSGVMVAQGTIALPLANETASSSPSDTLTPGAPNGTSNSGSGVVAGNQNGSGSGVVGEGQGAQDSASNGSGGNRGSGTRTGDGMGTGSGSDDGTISGNPFALDRITLPRNGQYGVVVVGASLEEEFPETHGMWTGRLAYTVYLHVGLPKNWILQYSLPRVVKVDKTTTRPDAPWPYLIVRPHLMPTDYDADAIMVHGFINSGGRFEQLAVVFPPQFPQTKFVLGSLQQWQFRPAVENGKQTPVEVLLIIPDEGE